MSDITQTDLSDVIFSTTSTGQPVRLVVYGRAFECQWRNKENQMYKIDGESCTYDVFKLIVQSLGVEDVFLAAITFDIILDKFRPHP